MFTYNIVITGYKEIDEPKACCLSLLPVFQQPLSISSFIKGIARHQLERILQAYGVEVVSVIVFVFGRNVEGIFSVQVYILSQNNIPFSQPESQLLCRCSQQHRLHDKVSIIRYPRKSGFIDPNPALLSSTSDTSRVVPAIQDPSSALTYCVEKRLIPGLFKSVCPHGKPAVQGTGFPSYLTFLIQQVRP